MLRRAIRQGFCRHDWSCGWSRRCQGVHYCLRCGATSTRRARKARKERAR